MCDDEQETPYRKGECHGGLNPASLGAQGVALLGLLPPQPEVKIL